MPPPVRVNITAPSGEVRSVGDGADLADMLRKGWTIQQPAQEATAAVKLGRESSAPGILETSLTEFTDALTFGGSTALATSRKFDDGANAERVKLGRAAHPIATPVSQVAGVLAQNFLIPGSSIVGIGAKGIAKVAAREAAIGAGQGAGKYIADAAIEDRDIAAEGLMASAGGTALLAGAGGGAIGATSRGLSRVKGMFPEGSVNKASAEAAQSLAAKDIADTLTHTDDLVRRGDEFVTDVGTARSADPVVLAHAAELKAARQAEALAAAPALAPRPAAAASPAGDDIASQIIARYGGAKPAATPEYESLWRAGDAPLSAGDVAREMTARRARGGLTDQALDGAPGATSVGRRRPATVTSEPLGMEAAPPAMGTPTDGRPIVEGFSDEASAIGTPVSRRAADPPRPVDAPSSTLDDIDDDLMPEPVAAPHPLATYDAQTQNAYDAKEALKNLADDAILGGNDALSQKVFMGPLRRQMGLSREEFETWIKAAQGRGEIELSRLDMPGMVTPSRLADAQDEAFRGPSGVDSGADRHLIRFIDPPSAATPAPAVRPPSNVIPIGGRRLAAPALDLEAALAATAQRLDGGASIGALNAERAVAAVDDDFVKAVLAADPQARKVKQLTEELRSARYDAEQILTGNPRDYAASLSRRADAGARAQRAAGTLSRDADAIAVPYRDPTWSQSSARGRIEGVRSRIRDPYTDDELIAKAANNPTFVEAGGVRTTARADLAERIAAGTTDPRALQVEDLVSRLDPATGEVLPGLAREMRPATSDDILGAVMRNRRNPAFKSSYVSDDILDALRGRLDDPDLERAIPAIARVEQASHDLAVALGQRAGAASQAHAAEYAARLAQHTETLGMAQSQTAAAISDAVTPYAAKTAAEAKAFESLGDATVANAAPSRARSAADDPDRTYADRFVDRGAVPRAPRAAAGRIEATAVDHAPLGAIDGALAKDAEIVGDVAKRPAGPLGAIADLGAALEVMSTVGIPGMPDPSKIPIVGPVLGLYLKARAGMALWRKLGGKLPASVESVVAKKSTQTRDRMASAVRSLVGVGEKATAAARIPVATAAVILSRPLFSETKSKPKNETVAESWQRHRNEIAAAKRPGALERVLRERVPTGDPRLAAAIVETARRRLDYLDAMMPRPPPTGGLPTDMPPWQPTPAQAESWARIVDATDDPAAVLERAATGDVSLEQIEAVRAVYPRLYQEAQVALIEAAVTAPSIPYLRRIQLGVLFAIPMTPTQDPQFIAAMQASHAAAASTESQQPAPRPSANADFSGGALLQEQRP